MNKIFALAGLVMLASPLSAAADEPAPKTIDTVTIIGHQTDPADVAGSAHVLDAEALEVFLDTDILRVLRAVPGVYLQEEEGFGLRPNIGIRGSGLDRSARIALLEDGVLIAPAPYAAPSAYYFPTQRRMQAVEVLKGPAAIGVGPRTTGGALNLVSTALPSTDGGSLDVRVGDHDTLDGIINYGQRGERVAWLLETVQSSANGYKRIDGVGGDTGYEISDYLGKFQINSRPQADVAQSLTVKMGYTDQTSDETYLGLTADDFAADPNRRYAASAEDVFNSDHRQTQLTYEFGFDSGVTGNVTAYRNEFNRNWYKLQSVNGSGIASVLEDPDAFVDELAWLKGADSPDDAIVIRANKRSYLSEGIQGRLSYAFDAASAQMTLTGGFRIHDDEEDRLQHEDGYRIQADELFLTSSGAPGSNTNRLSTASAQSVFIEANIDWGQWVLTPGLRYEDIDLARRDYSTADPSRIDGPTRIRRNSTSVVIPGVGALYKLNDKWRLVAGIHEGYNPPGPGSTADEETSTNVEAGFRYNDNRFSLELLGFHNDYDNLVGTVTESTGGGEIGEQFDGGEVTVSGIELSADAAWQAGQVSIPVSLRYTWTSDSSFDSAFDSDFGPWGEVQRGDELPYVPEHQLRAVAGIVVDRLSVNVAGNYVSDSRGEAGQGSIDNDPNGIAGRVIWDLNASWQFTDRLSSYLKVDNATDKTYVAATRPAGLRPGLPRTAYLGVRYRL